MTDELLVNDVQLKEGDIRQLQDANEIARFFGKLGYNIDRRVPIKDYGLLGLGGEDISYPIRSIEQIAEDPIDGNIKIYLMVMKSITSQLRNKIARRLVRRESGVGTDENYLLVLTKDFSELEFVLVTVETEKSRSRNQPFKRVIRPIPLTINRQNPDPNRDAVALRVLRRFTFTEEDADYQWEKLRSAYTLAEWSEQFFNNRALFSDYYLLHRLTDEALTPEWKTDPRPVGQQIIRHFSTARKNFSRQLEDRIRSGLYEPIFKVLGFHAVLQKSGNSADYQPDYLLYDPAKPDTPIAAALTYVWNRNLDDVDTSRDQETPDEIPGTIVVSILEKQAAPWVIVTNGKLWRLYSATTSNKATNYYEVDLEEALTVLRDQESAFKYWWLMFRREAFTGFLDKILKESAEYAKKLGENLKNRVFAEIFPEFAKGFIVHMRAQGVPQFDDATLAQVFSGTMTLLYRLMFALYAESLDLLPVREEPGYGEASLNRIKKEIAEVGKGAESVVKTKLRDGYSPTSTDLYKRLQELFGMVDKGNEKYNLPTYNGGLFSPDTPVGQFLNTYAVPDAYLAIGLDRLARDVDARTQGLVWVDFKSLGVRQLGSIYEGLLEFKLKIAEQDLAIVKEKDREVYKPAAEVKGRKLGTIDKGEVYLANDKSERKATGSYYTPDYIVKYIVQHTVGPVLERKFDELRPRLHEAQRHYRDAKKLAEKRGEDPEKFWELHEPNSAMSRLVDDCLNIRVLDPAMGSGHFLVEVVDFVSDKLIDFLNGWTENPVWAFLNRIRTDIMDDMERQGVTIDAEKLTRVALLKRAVLKRCVYGVDLNPMAVELAKVSLWLDAFTLGAPLSFLDHHLKCGNSLIGARLNEVDEALIGKLGEGTQLALFGSSSVLEGLKQAVAAMIQVSHLSDNTIAQASQSKSSFMSASDLLAPLKRAFDIYVSRWFGNTPSKRRFDTFDPAVIFLRDDVGRKWIYDPTVKLPQDGNNLAQVAQIAQSAAAEKRFFHWELEFPEVFFAPRTPGGQDVQLVEGGGFDAVVGNPPYLRVQTMNKVDLGFFDTRYQSASNNYDIYSLFIEQGLLLLSHSGKQGFIVPHKFFEADYGKSLRDLIAKGSHLSQVIHFGELQVFEDATIYVCLLILSRASTEVFDFHKVLDLGQWQLGKGSQDGKLSSELLQKTDEWNFVVGPDATLFYRFSKYPFNLGAIAEIFVGVQTSADDVFILDYLSENREKITLYSKSRAKAYSLEKSLFHPLVSGVDVSRYAHLYPRQYILFPYDIIGNQAHILSMKQIEKEYPNISKYLVENKNRLESRENGRLAGGNWHGYIYLKNMTRQEKTKLCIPRLVNRLTCTYDPDGSFYLDNVDVGGVMLRDEYTNYDYLYICALINSNFSNWYLYKISTAFRGNYISANKQFVSLVPIRVVDFTTPTDQRERLAQLGRAKYQESLKQSSTTPLLDFTTEHLGAGRSDVVHDVLAHLAERMIALNKDKQAETKRFLAWLENRLKIKPDKDGSADIASLTGYTLLQNYLGDYQKGEGERSWGDFEYRLFQNRKRFGVTWDDALKTAIQTEYEKSLGTLRPIKQALARTDALIDRIVYQLYGLTAEEIELIERPQYEQALVEAVQQVAKDQPAELPPDPDKREEIVADAEQAIADHIKRQTERYFERVSPEWVENRLRADVVGWDKLSQEIRIFLLTADYMLMTAPEHLDFSPSVISYAKAVESVVMERIFVPFRDNSRYTEADCNNQFLKAFMRKEKSLTLGNFGKILASSGERMLQAYLKVKFSGSASQRLQAEVIKRLNDEPLLALRNSAAHKTVMQKSDAQTIRDWAMGIFGGL